MADELRKGPKVSTITLTQISCEGCKYFSLHSEHVVTDQYREPEGHSQEYGMCAHPEKRKARIPAYRTPASCPFNPYEQSPALHAHEMKYG